MPGPSAEWYCAGAIKGPLGTLLVPVEETTFSLGFGFWMGTLRCCPLAPSSAGVMVGGVLAGQHHGPRCCLLEEGALCTRTPVSLSGLCPGGASQGQSLSRDPHCLHSGPCEQAFPEAPGSARKCRTRAKLEFPSMSLSQTVHGAHTVENSSQKSGVTWASYVSAGGLTKALPGHLGGAEALCQLTGWVEWVILGGDMAWLFQGNDLAMDRPSVRGIASVAGRWAGPGHWWQGQAP